jgi:hypothetical protein
MPTFSEVSVHAVENHIWQAGNSCESALARRLLIEARMRGETHCDATKDYERRRYGGRILHDAFTSAGVRIERR